MKKIGRSFYQRDAEKVARDLIGAVLVRRARGRECRARIVEAEAYVGPQDLASHSSRGRTKRTEVMFGPPGHAYVYLVYGMYEMFNIVAGKTGGEIRGTMNNMTGAIKKAGPGFSGPAFHCVVQA